jgi:hypothetical protein
MVLIEGSAGALKFFADVPRAIASRDGADTMSLSPTGSGNFHFAPEASHNGCILRV